jgi:hypothetical protein
LLSGSALARKSSSAIRRSETPLDFAVYDMQAAVGARGKRRIVGDNHDG